MFCLDLNGGLIIILSGLHVNGTVDLIIWTIDLIIWTVDLIIWTIDLIIWTTCQCGLQTSLAKFQFTVNPVLGSTCVWDR